MNEVITKPELAQGPGNYWYLTCPNCGTLGSWRERWLAKEIRKEHVCHTNLVPS